MVKKTYFLAVIIILGMIIMSIFFLSSNSEDLRKYDAQGVSFDYPGDYILHNSSIAGGIIKGSNKKVYFEISKKRVDEPFDLFISKTRNPVSDVMVEEQRLAVNGVKAYQATYYIDGHHFATATYFYNDKIVYTIKFISTGEVPNSTDVKTVINSFRLN